MSDASNSFRAGLVILLGIGVGLGFFFSSKKSTLEEDNSKFYYALLTDASGLNSKSLITVAGLQIGEIQNIRLVEVSKGDMMTQEEREKTDDKIEQERIRVARVDMRITNDVQIPVDTLVKKDSLGLLGAKALLMDLGQSTEYVADKGRILNVRSVTAMDALLGRAEGIVDNLNNITKKIDDDVGGILKDVHGITTTLNGFVSGSAATADGKPAQPPLSELYQVAMTDLRRTAETIEKTVRDVDTLLLKNGKSITGLVDDVHNITSSLSELMGTPGSAGSSTGTGTGNTGAGNTINAPSKEGSTGTGNATANAVGSTGNAGNAGDLRATLASVRKISDDLAKVTGSVAKIVGENEGELSGGVKELKTTLTELNKSLTSLSNVTSSIEKGEGTVGRLLMDEDVADKVESAISGASDYVSGLTSLETRVDVGTWYNFNRGLATTTLGVKLLPKPDKYYQLELVDDGGNIERLTRVFPSDPTEVRTATASDDNQLRITAVFAKRFWDVLVLRAGLIETSGGLGANLMLFDDRFELRTDLFNFGGPKDKVAADDPRFENIFALPRWRTYIKAQPIPFVYLTAGVDDVLNYQHTPQVNGFGFDYFFGAGITFRDDDFRMILPFIPN